MSENGRNGEGTAKERLVDVICDQLEQLVEVLATEREAGREEEDQIRDVIGAIRKDGDFKDEHVEKVAAAVQTRGDRYHRRGSQHYAMGNAFRKLTKGG